MKKTLKILFFALCAVLALGLCVSAAEDEAAEAEDEAIVIEETVSEDTSDDAAEPVEEESADETVSAEDAADEDVIADDTADEADTAEPEADKTEDEETTVIINASDVDANDWAYSSVTNLLTRGLIIADAEGKINPDETVTKAYALELVAKARGKEITEADAQGNATRADIATAIVESLNANIDNYSQSSFTDVASDAEYAKHIECAKTLNIVNGYEDGSFRPAAEITKRELIVMVDRMVRLLDALKA